jgi:hypothetical protein
MNIYERLMLLAIIVTALGGVGFVVVMIQTYTEQMNAQVFSDLNQRYGKKLKDFPKEAGEMRLKLETSLPPESKALTWCALRYLSLISEAFYLYKRNHICRDV